MAEFEAMWTHARQAFAGSDYTRESQPGTLFRSSRDGLIDLGTAPPQGDQVPADDDGASAAGGTEPGPSEPGEPGEPAPYDPADDGWIRVEDHEAALEAARTDAAEQARAALLAEQDGEGERVKGLVAELERLVEERQWLRKEVIGDAAEDVAGLILELSRRVVGETLAVHPRSLQHLVREAMAALPGDEPVRVRVRPEDLPILEAHLDSRRPITWVPDPELRSGVVVQTDLGQVEASLETAFAALQTAVSDWVEQQRS